MALSFAADETPYIHDIAALEKVCFSEPWSVQALAEFLSYPYNHAIVALWEDAFAGYITYTSIAGETQIANVAVEPLFRKQQIGSAMLERLIKQAKKQDETIFLEVRVSNIAAIALYEKHGFVKNGERKDFYVNPKENAALYHLCAGEIR